MRNSKEPIVQAERDRVLQRKRATRGRATRRRKRTKRAYFRLEEQQAPREPTRGHLRGGECGKKRVEGHATATGTTGE